MKEVWHVAEETMVVVASKVREYIKSKNVKVSSELMGALNKKILRLLDDAVVRTQANKRSTVKPQDV